jgi:aminoglycoside phosphotransferase (APT) family kinase protein
MAEYKPLPDGIPTEQEFVQRYAERTGRDIDARDYEFAIVCAMFRLAAILQGIVKRAKDGTASNPKALETGLKARGIAEAACRSVQLNFR